MEGFVVMLGVIQGIFIMIDELTYHRRRSLGVFERWGHVADSILFATTLAIAALFEPNGLALPAFMVMALLSSLVVTKDEWIHAASCSGGEHWVHAVLFLLHGSVLMAIGFLWIMKPGSWVLPVMPWLVMGWGLYQFLYWNVYDPWKNGKPGEHTPTHV